MMKARSCPAARRCSSQVRQLRACSARAVLIERHDEIARGERGQHALRLLSLGADGAAAAATGSPRGRQLYELEPPGTAQAARIVVEGRLDPGRHASADRDHAQAHPATRARTIRA